MVSKENDSKSHLIIPFRHKVVIWSYFRLKSPIFTANFTSDPVYYDQTLKITLNITMSSMEDYPTKTWSAITDEGRVFPHRNVRSSSGPLSYSTNSEVHFPEKVWVTSSTNLPRVVKDLS